MNNQSSIKVKLLSNGRYTWEINLLFGKYKEDLARCLNAIDDDLREQFPMHTMPASGRTVELED